MSVQISLCVFALNSFQCILRSGIAESCGHSIIQFLRTYHTDFHSGCTIFHSYQQCARVLISLHLHQHLFFSGFCFCSYGSHPIGLKKKEFFISGMIPVFYPNINPMVARLSLLTLVHNCPSEQQASSCQTIQKLPWVTCGEGCMHALNSFSSSQ